MRDTPGHLIKRSAKSGVWETGDGVYNIRGLSVARTFSLTARPVLVTIAIAGLQHFNSGPKKSAKEQASTSEQGNMDCA